MNAVSPPCGECDFCKADISVCMQDRAVTVIKKLKEISKCLGLTECYLVNYPNDPGAYCTCQDYSSEI